MRRVDPVVVALTDGEATAVAAYADSDVGSSPRSITAGGGRPGSLTDEPPPAVRWDESAFARVKLMCSYGGRILPRPHDNQLRYVGGESRLAVVSRGITLSDLTSKLGRMFSTSVLIKYQLPYEDLDALISVTSDEDLEIMMEEYDRLPSAGNRPSARLRLFLFPLKLERSQTASLSELMDSNHSRERWFVDILNGFPTLPQVRSETSSIVSETPDCFFQGNLNALQEWADATSYGNSVAPPQTEESPSRQDNSVSAAALFGSLLQHTGSNEVASAPGSPLPLKQKPLVMGSSSSAPPAVISLLSAMVEAASKELPTPTHHVAPVADGSKGTHTSKTRLGSGDGSVAVPEQRKHVDGEIVLTSDKTILTSSAGGAEQLLPAGFMDDDDASQKLSAKGSFDEVCGNPQNVIFDAVVSDTSMKALRGDLASEGPALMGQPIFDEEVLPVNTLARNLKALQLEDSSPSPVVSPSGGSSAPPQISSTVVMPQQPISVAVKSKAAADDKLKQQVFPVSPRAGALVSSDDKVMQPILPPTVPHVTTAKPDVEDVFSRQVLPSLAHFLPPASTPQQGAVLSNVVREDMVRQIPGTNVTKDAEMMIKPQLPPPITSGASAIPMPALAPPTLPQPAMQKLPAVTPSNFFYHGQALEVPMSATAYVAQAQGVQLPIMSQTGVATNPLPPIAAPIKPINVATAARPVAGTSRPQSPHTVMTGGMGHPVPQVRATSPPASAPPMMPTNVEVLKGLTSVATNTSPPAVFSSMGEGVRSIPSTVYAQGEAVNPQRQVSDPVPSHRMAAVGPHPSSQFNLANLNAAPAPGIPTRFRAVGRPVQAVAEGIPIQQSPGVGVIPDKKAPVASQQALANPSMRPPLAPGGQYSYFMPDQSNVMPHSAAIGVTPRFNTPANIMVGAATSAADTLPFPGANPFADNFQPAPTYPDVLEGSPADQQQRRQMRP